MAEAEKIQWFPMRVTYNREQKMKKVLDERGVENFLPMRYEYEKCETFSIKRKLIPAVHGLIFVHSFRKQLSEMKRRDPALEPLRYMTNHMSTGFYKKVLTIPDRQMENFMGVVNTNLEKIEYLDQTAYLLKPGKRVRITEGEFKGYEGVIKRFKKRQQVVVQIKGLVAVAITFVPRAWLEEIGD